MRYVEFHRRMAPYTVFSIGDARMVEPDFDRRRLHEWCGKGYISMVAKGYYRFTDVDIADKTLDLIANRLYAPSYVSLETALSRAGLLPDTVRQVTSVTTRKTRTIKTDLGTFTYRTVTPRLFFGYAIESRGAKVAILEKAILDYLYLHADLRTQQDYESLRIDRQELSARLDRQQFDGLLARFNVKALRQRATKFMEWVRYA